jgi:flagellar biosynthetic protein FliQ
MSQGWAMDLARESIILIFKLSGPILLLGLIVGVVVSMFQAATQIQEASLSFIPKLIVVFLSILIFGSWMIRVLTDFSSHIFGNLHTLVR